MNNEDLCTPIERRVPISISLPESLIRRVDNLVVSLAELGLPATNRSRVIEKCLEADLQRRGS